MLSTLAVGNVLSRHSPAVAVHVEDFRLKISTARRAPRSIPWSMRRVLYIVPAHSAKMPSASSALMCIADMATGNVKAFVVASVALIIQGCVAGKKNSMVV